MPSSPMLITPARSDHSPPSPANRIGSSSRTAAWVVPLEVSWSCPVSVAVIDRIAIPTATTSAERAQPGSRRRAAGRRCGPARRAAAARRSRRTPVLTDRRPASRGAARSWAATRRCSAASS